MSKYISISLLSILLTLGVAAPSVVWHYTDGMNMPEIVLIRALGAVWSGLTLLISTLTLGKILGIIKR